MKIKKLIIFGARLAAKKMASLVKELKKNPEQFETLVCITAQDRQILDQVFGFFEITMDKVVLDFCGVIK